MENFRRRIVLILFPILFCCNPVKKENTESVKAIKDQSIKLHLTSGSNRKNLNISLAFLDVYGNRVQYDYDLSKGKQHDLKIESKEPIYLKDLSFKQTFYLVYPGERLRLELDSNDFFSFKPINKDTLRSNELNFFNAYSQVQSESNKLLIKALAKFPGIRDILATRKVEAFLEYLLMENEDAQKGINYSLQKHKNQVAYLETYHKSHPISDIYKERLLKFFMYEDLKFRLSIINHKLSKNKESNLEKQIPEIIKKLNCDSCLYLPSYKEAIQNYVKYRYHSVKKDKLPLLYRGIKEEFSGATADFALFTMIKYALAENNNEYKAVFNQFKKESKNPIYPAYLQDYDKVKSIIPSENTILMQADGKLTNLDKVLAAQKGKVVLLDFWASWCLPCKAQMPYSEKLKEKYNNQAVKFIYLSLDEQKSAWEASNKQLNLSSSYLVMDNFKSNLSKQLTIKTIPRYVLIDKLGKISNKDAPRPNDKKLADDIDALLKKLN